MALDKILIVIIISVLLFQRSERRQGARYNLTVDISLKVLKGSWSSRQRGERDVV